MVADVIIAHEMAWTKAQVLHRDISASNILIWEDPKTGERVGILSDWDLCKYAEHLGDVLRYDRTVRFTPHRCVIM